MLKFFLEQIDNARNDPFFPCRNNIHAAFWVIRHWRWLRKMDREGWPSPTLKNSTP